MSMEQHTSKKMTPFAGRRLVAWPLALIGLTLALLFVANSVSAWGRRSVEDIDGIKSHAEHFVERALDRLDATDEQEAAIQGIVSRSIENLHALRGDREVDREALRNLMLANSIDRDAVEAFRAEKLRRADEMRQRQQRRARDPDQLRFGEHQQGEPRRGGDDGSQPPCLARE